MSILLDFQVIREDVIPTSPPTVEKINSFQFLSGEQRVFAIQLINAYNKKPFILPTGWQAVIELKTIDPLVFVTHTMVINATDRSVLNITLTSAETPILVSGRVKITISEIADPTNLMIASKDGVFTKTKLDC